VAVDLGEFELADIDVAETVRLMAAERVESRRWGNPSSIFLYIEY
jgi:hypothetical protein